MKKIPTLWQYLKLTAGAALLSTLASCGIIKNHNSIDDVVLNSQRPAQTTVSENNIGHRILDIENTARDREREYLDHLINLACKRIKPRKHYTKKQAINVLKRIHNILEEENYDYLEAFGFLSKALELQSNSQRYNNCQSCSFIYLAIAEELGLPLNAVSIRPKNRTGHMFIRFYFENGNYLNWETTTGEKVPDKEYEHNYKLSSDEFKIRNTEQVLGGVYYYCAFGKKGNRDSKRTIDFLTKAIRRDPNDVFYYRARARARVEAGDFEDAFKDYAKVIELDPADSSNYVSRAIARGKGGDLKGAVDDWTKVIKFEPTDSINYFLRSFAKHDSGDLKGAIEDLNKAIRLNSTRPGYYYIRAKFREKAGDVEGANADHAKKTMLLQIGRNQYCCSLAH